MARYIKGIENITKYTLNEYGHRIKAEFDYNADKVADRIEYYIKTPEGNTEAIYWDWDGKATTGYEHKINGETAKGISTYHKHILNERGEIIEAYLDTNGDIKFEQHSYDVRDARNRLIEMYRDSDNNSETGNTYETADGRTLNGIEWREFRSYNEQNQLVQTRRDNNNDGFADEISNLKLSAANQVLYTEYSRGISRLADGEFPLNKEADLNKVKITSIDFHESTTHHEDFTTAEWAERLKTVGGKLDILDLGNDSTADALTLNKQTIAAFVNSAHTITIKGNEAKTVNLSDISASTKQPDVVKNGDDDYAKYQFEHNGDTYTLNIDTDIHVDFGMI